MNDSQKKTYQNLETLAKLMDDQFEVFGFRFGLNFLIDLLPEIGDIITTVIAIYIFLAALKFNISKTTILRMAFNIFLYFLIGLIPWLGDIFGAWWKPNKRNLQLLQEQLGQLE